MRIADYASTKKKYIKKMISSKLSVGLQCLSLAIRVQKYMLMIIRRRLHPTHANTMPNSRDS
jgi:hypothetical protein